MECRIGMYLDDISSTALCDMPEEETVTCEQFLKLTDDVVAAASASLVAGSAAAERAVYEIIDVSIFKVFYFILTQSSLLLSTS